MRCGASLPVLLHHMRCHPPSLLYHSVHLLLQEEEDGGEGRRHRGSASSRQASAGSGEERFGVRRGGREQPVPQRRGVGDE